VLSFRDLAGALLAGARARPRAQAALLGAGAPGAVAGPAAVDLTDAGLGAAAEVHVLAGVIRRVVVVVGAAAAVPGAVLVVPVAAAGGAVIAIPTSTAVTVVRVVAVAADLLELVVLAHVGAAGAAVADGLVHVAVAAVLVEF